MGTGINLQQGLPGESLGEYATAKNRRNQAYQIFRGHLSHQWQPQDLFLRTWQASYILFIVTLPYLCEIAKYALSVQICQNMLTLKKKTQDFGDGATIHGRRAPSRTG